MFLREICSLVFVFVVAVPLVIAQAQRNQEQCEDHDTNCEHWLRFCKNNDWVQKSCKKTCDKCPESKPATFVFNDARVTNQCRDDDENCATWVADDQNLCRTTDYIQKHCRRSCQTCVDGELPDKYNLQKLPEDLRPMSWLIGRWRSEHGGKARFPTIPVFTYGEQLDFSIADPSMFGPKAINYTSFAWSINNKDELHSEYGFIAIKDQSRDVAMTTVMNNGFTTVEEGEVEGNRVRLRLQDIGRITFSRDLPVHDLTREWVLVDRNTLEQSLDMETLTHPMQQHTFIRYKKIYP